MRQCVHRGRLLVAGDYNRRAAAAFEIPRGGRQPFSRAPGQEFLARRAARLNAERLGQRARCLFNASGSQA
ncbi:hypothetical protein D3C83_183770 [compost metagenome]